MTVVIGRTPINIGPRTYCGPLTVDGVMQWVHEIQREYARAVETALLDGEIDDMDLVDDILSDLQRSAATTREEFRRTLERITT